MKHREMIIINRLDVIRNFVTGKTVLDMGCIGHSADREGEADWLHKHIKEAASEVVGVDILEEEARRLNNLGYKVVVGDVEKVDLGRQFDVVVAANIIEHLSNPGVFLENVKKHLKDDGHFIITTDSCYALRYLKQIIMEDEVYINREHVLTFEPQCLRQLLSRHGFTVNGLYFYNELKKDWLSRAIQRLLWDWAVHFRKSLAFQIMVVARKR